MRYNTTKNVRRICKNCGDPFMARSADVNRGWANFCSKSCKAREQTHRTEYAGPVGSGDDHNFDPSWDTHKDWLFTKERGS